VLGKKNRDATAVCCLFLIPDDTDRTKQFWYNQRQNFDGFINFTTLPVSASIIRFSVIVKRGLFMAQVKTNPEAPMSPLESPILILCLHICSLEATCPSICEIITTVRGKKMKF
jgi:hypothetical protein